MWKRRVIAVIVLLVGAGIGFFVYHTEVTGSWPFKLSLDLSGGTQLLYRADVSHIASGDVADSMASLRDTIERRVNLFGVAEPIVQTESSSALSGVSEQRLDVELPGVTDTQKAIALIGETPVLEFRLLKQGAIIPTDTSTTSIDAAFEPAALTGKDLTSAQMQFSQGMSSSNDAEVVLQFNAEGTKLFADLTKNNVGKVFGIFLDGSMISAPRICTDPNGNKVCDGILDGTAVISGNFNGTQGAEQARELARNLNEGALPVPIELIGHNTVSGTFGVQAVNDGIMAGIYGVGAVMLFMLLWYRLPGLIASLALCLYIAFMLALFKFLGGPFQVTLSAAGIAGFILSIGMAVDANILIFERTKEELRAGKSATDAIHDGFARAWPSIRDSNTSSIITAIVLFWFGTSLIKGFAYVFGLGVLVSMLTAISVSRTFLLALGIKAAGGFVRFLFGSGIQA